MDGGQKLPSYGEDTSLYRPEDHTVVLHVLFNHCQLRGQIILLRIYESAEAKKDW